MTLETALYGLFALLCGGLALLMFGRRLILKGADAMPEPRAARLDAIWKRGVWPMVASVVVLGIGTLTRGDTLGTLLEVSGGLFMVGAIFGVLYFVMFSVELRKASPVSAAAPVTDAAVVATPEETAAAPAATASTGD